MPVSPQRAASVGAGAGLREYRAKNNDTPTMIAAQFGVRAADIVRLNRLLLLARMLNNGGLC